MSEMVLELSAICKRYGQGAAARVVLEDASLTLARGQAVTIVGPSGSGKSTLLNIAGSLDSPTSGRVCVEGRDLSAMSAAALAAIRNERIGFVFQLHHLLPQCTALENVLIPTLARRGGPPAGAVERAKTLLDRVGLSRQMTHRPGQLSGGERQRVAVARALINSPVLLLADEPTGSLDREAAESLGELLGQTNRAEGVAMVLVTHSEALAQRIGNVRRLVDGRLGPAGQ
jgi:ABC-type lipoprotein export system ATPase subunit